MNDPKTEDIKVSHTVRISRAEYEYSRARVEHLSEGSIREAIAGFIARERVPLTVGEHYVERRLDLYVATPAQFWEAVHREAEKIAMRFAPR